MVRRQEIIIRPRLPLEKVEIITDPRTGRQIRVRGGRGRVRRIRELRAQLAREGREVDIATLRRTTIETGLGAGPQNVRRRILSELRAGRSLSDVDPTGAGRAFVIASGLEAIPGPAGPITARAPAPPPPPPARPVAPAIVPTAPAELVGGPARRRDIGARRALGILRGGGTPEEILRLSPQARAVEERLARERFVTIGPPARVTRARAAAEAFRALPTPTERRLGQSLPADLRGVGFAGVSAEELSRLQTLRPSPTRRAFLRGERALAGVQPRISRFISPGVRDPELFRARRAEEVQEVQFRTELQALEGITGPRATAERARIRTEAAGARQAQIGLGLEIGARRAIAERPVVAAAEFGVAALAGGIFRGGAGLVTRIPGVRALGSRVGRRAATIAGTSLFLGTTAAEVLAPGRRPLPERVGAGVTRSVLIAGGFVAGQRAAPVVGRGVLRATRAAAARVSVLDEPPLIIRTATRPIQLQPPRRALPAVRAELARRGIAPARLPVPRAPTLPTPGRRPIPPGFTGIKTELGIQTLRPIPTGLRPTIPGVPAGLLSPRERLARFAAREGVTLRAPSTATRPFQLPRPTPRRPGVPQRLRGIDPLTGRGRIEPTRRPFVELIRDGRRQVITVDPTTGRAVFIEIGAPARGPVRPFRRPTPTPALPERRPPPPTRAGLVSLEVARPVRRRTLLPRQVTRPQETARRIREQLQRSLQRGRPTAQRRREREQATLAFRQLFQQPERTQVATQQLRRATGARRAEVRAVRRGRAQVIGFQQLDVQEVRRQRAVTLGAVSFGRVRRLDVRFARELISDTRQRVVPVVEPAVRQVTRQEFFPPPPRAAPARVVLPVAPSPPPALLPPRAPPLPRPPRIPTEPVSPRQPFRLPRFERERVEGVRGQGFNVLVKEKGKKTFFKANTDSLPRNKALNFGANIVDNSAAATFKVRRAKTQTELVDDPSFSKAGKFRSPKGKSPLREQEPVLIEKNLFRIDSLGERQQITAKGLIARREAAQRRRAGQPQKSKKRRRRNTNMLF